MNIEKTTDSLSVTSDTGAKKEGFEKKTEVDLVH